MAPRAPAPAGPPADGEPPEVSPDGSVQRDPFSAHLEFVDAWASPRAHTLAADLRIEPIAPMDVGRREIVDFDALEALATWQGTFKMPRVKTKEELPSEVEEAMRECEPQFILRNIARAESFSEPDEKLQTERKRLEYGLDVEGARTVANLQYQPAELLEVSSFEQTRYDQRWRRWLRDVTPWGRHFGHEVKHAISGPQWRYDPYAPSDDPDAPTPLTGPGPPKPVA